MSIKNRLSHKDWPAYLDLLDNKGHMVLPQILDAGQCANLIQQYEEEGLYRKTIEMARYRFGEGQYKYFCYPLPEIVSQLRELLYPKLAPLANLWMKRLNIPNFFPDTAQEFKQLCQQKGQTEATPLILKYKEGGYNTLHQDLYGEIYFPLQAIVSLSEPDQDYRGGELLLIEQQPRAQSRGIVLRPNLGDVVVIATSFRPVKGSRGYYRVNMKHGVSEVMEGQRYTLGIIFHDGR